LFDIAVEPIADERARFNVARSLSALGPPAFNFAKLRAALDTSEQVVARGASKAFLARVNQALEPFGLTAHVVLSRGGAKRGWAAAAAAVVIAVGVGVGWWRVNRMPAQVVALPPSATAPAPTAAAAQALDRKKVASAVVQLSCDRQLGAGFFVDEDRVLTNAHVVCADATLLKVQLPDGRTLMGKVVRRDDWLDFALVQVAGASVEPLKLGDSTRLAEGDAIALVGSPRGLSFTWHEGKVSYVGRNVLGIAYVQLDASVNPGNSGGPLVNAAGEAVGIVSMKVTSADGIGLALPIEYVEPPTGAQLDRWKGVLAKVAKENARAVDETAAGIANPLLLQAGVAAGGVEVRVLARSQRGTLDFELRDGAQVICRDQARVQQWISMERLLAEHPEQLAKRREVMWELKSGALKDVDGAAGLVSLEGCDLAGLQRDPDLVLLGGTEGQDRLQLPHEQLVALARSRVQTAQAPADPSQSPPDLQLAAQRARNTFDAQAADRWRSAFAQAKARVEAAERERDDAQRALDSGGYDWMVTRHRRMLAQAEARLHDAQEAERDLERQAAAQSVPLEWRR
jgi:serine protease Do